MILLHVQDRREVLYCIFPKDIQNCLIVKYRLRGPTKNKSLGSSIQTGNRGKLTKTDTTTVCKRSKSGNHRQVKDSACLSLADRIWPPWVARVSRSPCKLLRHECRVKTVIESRVYKPMTLSPLHNDLPKYFADLCSGVVFVKLSFNTTLYSQCTEIRHRFVKR